MNALEVLIDVAGRPKFAAEMLRGRLTPELLNAHPHHDNSIAWLLWHSAREIDEQLADITGGETVWVRDGMADRFGFAVEPGEHGYGHSPERARQIVCDDADLLIDHLIAVIDAQIAVLESLDEAELSRIVDERWDPPVSLATRMTSMSLDALEHVAQAMYIAGMGADAFE
ncbi:DinB family protein [Leucobacter sp. gxy201]|uniref:DinB family protein n=1 Tax=Leucobacter sp. gxy201 TaxID=2957200 RepID=UPI003D9FCA8E